MRFLVYVASPRRAQSSDRDGRAFFAMRATKSAALRLASKFSDARVWDSVRKEYVNA